MGGSAYTKASHKGNRYKAVHQMDTCYINDGIEMMKTKWGRDIDQTGVIPDAYTDIQ
jgi:hypothetical protein